MVTLSTSPTSGLNQALSITSKEGLKTQFSNNIDQIAHEMLAQSIFRMADRQQAHMYFVFATSFARQAQSVTQEAYKLRAKNKE